MSSEDNEKLTMVQVKCPFCDHTEIIYVPKEHMPKCPEHDVKMNILEILEEGKSC
jgi:ribosomal protein S27E